MSIHIFSLFQNKKKFEMQKKCCFPLLSCHFLFILTVLMVVGLKIMKLGDAMALGTHFVDSKHDQNVAVSVDIIITLQAVFPFLSGVERCLLFSIFFVCSVIRSNRNSDAGKKDQNSL